MSASERTEFIYRYMNRELQFTQIDFLVSYIQGDDDLVPGPTNYEIRTIAKVPAGDVSRWLLDTALVDDSESHASESQAFAGVVDTIAFPSGNSRLYRSTDKQKVVLYFPDDGIVCAHWFSQ